MQKIRENCFWHHSFKDMSATIDQCDLAEPWTCPCSDKCEWFIERLTVKDYIYHLLNKQMIRKN